MQDHDLGLPEPQVDPIPVNAGGDAAGNVEAEDGSDSDSYGWGLLDAMEELDGARALTDENENNSDTDSDFDLAGLSISDVQRSKESIHPDGDDQHQESVAQIEA